MLGLAMMEGMTLSGHPSIINKIKCCFMISLEFAKIVSYINVKPKRFHYFD